MTRAIRELAETQVILPFVEDAVAAGYTLGVYDGEEQVLPPTSDPPAVMAALFSVDEEYITVCRGGKPVGWVYLVHGNGGWDVVSDYTTNLAPLMARSIAAADRLSR